LLLIAVTGPIGSGKSTLLAAIAAEQAARGRRVDGFVAAAGRRPEAGRGADTYALRWVASGYEMPFAERAEADGGSGRPPYRFDEAGLLRVRAWAGSLADQPAIDLVVLDEFGRAEALGEGLSPIWQAVESARPAAVAVGLREGIRSEVEERIGRPFDIVIDAGDPNAPQRLREACLARDDWERVGLFGAGAGGIEVTAGSALHGARVPLRGLALSTTQSVVLAFAGDGLGRRVRVAGVAFVAAGLKALSPAGSRLRPMVAITAQGILFTLATRLVGWNRAGLFAGGALVGLWAGAQGVLMQWLLVGQELFRGYEVLAGWAAERGLGLPALATLVALWAGTWGLFAGTVTAWAWRRGSVAARIERAIARAPASSLVGAPAATWRVAARGALRDLARPSFWLPVLVLAAILLAAGSPAERAAWIGLRAFAVGLVLFALARRLDPRRAGAWLRRRGRWGPALALERALGRGK
jgi:nucleoside-triphosphatase THEP1